MCCARLQEQGCQPEGLPSASVLAGEDSWQKKPGETSGAFLEKLTTSWLVQCQDNRDPAHGPPQGLHHTDTILGNRRQKRV